MRKTQSKIEEIRTKANAALPDVNKVIKQHGFDTVRYVINQLSAKQAIKNRVRRMRQEANTAIAELQSKLRA